MQFMKFSDAGHPPFHACSNQCRYISRIDRAGMLMTRNAPNRANALTLMKFLASDEAQRLYAEGNFEYPVNPAIAASGLVRPAWPMKFSSTTDLAKR